MYLYYSMYPFIFKIREAGCKTIAACNINCSEKYVISITDPEFAFDVEKQRKL